MSSLGRELLTSLPEGGVRPDVFAWELSLGGRGALSGISRESGQKMVEGRSEPWRETKDN